MTDSGEHRVALPVALRPLLEEANKSYAAWREARDDAFGAVDAAACERELLALLREFAADAIEAGMERQSVIDALRRSYPEASLEGVVEPDPPASAGRDKAGTVGASSTPSDARRDLYWGAVGLCIGIAGYLFMQGAQDQLAADPFRQFGTPSNFWSGAAVWKTVSAVFVVAGLFYVARGLMIQNRRPDERGASAVSPPVRPLVECPVCKEQIRLGAERCRFCGARIDKELAHGNS